MKELIIKNKGKYLRDNYPFMGVPKLTDKRYCVHCEKNFTVKDYKVFLVNKTELICCPNAPECNGTVIDWMHVIFRSETF